MPESREFSEQIAPAENIDELQRQADEAMKENLRLRREFRHRTNDPELSAALDRTCDTWEEIQRRISELRNSAE